MKRNRFTDLFPKDKTYDKKSRVSKAKKIVAVLKAYKGDLPKLTCLDVGSSTGLIASHLSLYFEKVVGVDVDEQAIRQAKDRSKKTRNLQFVLSGENLLPFKGASFDVVIFNQVYEHVGDPKMLFKEIKRVLKKGGVCFFGARNRYGGPYDGHYNLPFIAWLPRRLANIYISLCTGKSIYDVRLYALKQLRKLTGDFKLHDYTKQIIKDPDKYASKDVVPTKWGINKLIYILSDLLYSIIPNYIWLLEKK